MPSFSSLSTMRPTLLQRLAHRGPQSFLAHGVSSSSSAVARPTTPRHGHAQQQQQLLHLPLALLSPSSRRRLSISPRPRQQQQQQQDAHRPHMTHFSEPHITHFNEPPSPPPPPQQPPRRRRGRWLFSATFFLLVGALGATVVRALVSPPPLPAQGSERDRLHAERVRGWALKLPLVQKLLEDPDWTHHEAYSSIPPDSRANRLTTGPLGSSIGIGAYQHIFHHRPAQAQPSSPSTSSTSTPDDAGPGPEVINVIYFGPGTTGFPTMVHGGALATVLDEHGARAALDALALRGPGQRQGVLTARLDLQYRRPTGSQSFYVARARALGDDELDPSECGKRDRKLWVDLVLETPAGQPCVTGRALFVIPRGRELRGVPEGF